MKTLYAYCPRCKVDVRVDEFAGGKQYSLHRTPKNKACKNSAMSCFYIARDKFAGASTDGKAASFVCRGAGDDGLLCKTTCGSQECKP